MNLSIRFPNISAYFEGMNKSFTVFGFEITVYGILVAVGMLLGLAVIMLQVRKHKENPNLYLGMVLISLIGGVIGARLYYLAFSWEAFSGKPWTELINIRGGGLAIYGGIFGGALAGFIYCKIRKVSFGQMADTVSIGLLTGQIIGVWGNAFNREAFGEYTDSLFAMQIPLESVHSSAVTKQMRDNLVMVLDEPFIQVHPLFLYESIWCLLLLIVLLILGRRKSFQGEIFLCYLAGYGLGKCGIEWLRTDSLYIPGTKISVSLLVSVVLFLVCGVTASVRHALSRKRNALRSRRREEAYAPDEKTDGSRLTDVQNFENVQDEFKEILDRSETSAPSEQIEQEDQKQEGSSEAASAQPETGPDHDQTE